MLRNFMSRFDVSIRDMEQSDFPKLSAIHGQGFARGWSDGEIEKLLASDHYFCLVAIRKGGNSKNPLGFMIAKSIEDEAEIITIAVDKSARSRGVGSKLVQETIRKLQYDRVKSLFLEVDESNQPAIKLYSRNQFRLLNTREGYYKDALGNPANALVMQRQLG